jgi:hypothetical protein
VCRCRDIFLFFNNFLARNLYSRKWPPPLHEGGEAAGLRRIWKANEQTGGQRLKAMLADWLPQYKDEHCKMDAELHKKILAISAAKIDRLLAPRKLRFGNRGVA